LRPPDAWQSHLKVGAEPDPGTRGDDFAMMHLDEPLDDREPDAEPAIRAIECAVALHE